jgi:hypothetical protein
MQLQAELRVTKAAAASDLNTEVRIQTLRARIARNERLAATLTGPATTASTDAWVIVETRTLQRLIAQLDSGDVISSASGF